jgi:zinc transporter ZupT
VTEPAEQSPSPPLEYASPREPELRAGRMALQAIVGCSLTCGLLMGGVFFGLLFAFASGGSTPYAILAIAIGAMLLGAVIALGVQAHRNPKRRGWAMGIWIGIGLAALLEGLCFGGMMF